MKRLISLGAVLALLATACSSGSAAIVDGSTISTAQVADLLAGSSAPDEGPFNDMLYQMVVDILVSAAAAEDFQIEVSAEQIQEGKDQIAADLEASGLTMETALENAGFSENVLEMIVRQEAIQRALDEEFAAQVVVDESEIQAFYDTIIAQTAGQVCASHILVSTEAEAQTAYDRAIAGEDFAQLAIELSTGPSGPDGGDLGCADPAGYVVEFSDAMAVAEFGVPTPPVESEFGFHVILIRPQPTIDEYRGLIVDDLSSSGLEALVTGWYIEQLREADVQIADEFGIWEVPADDTLPPSIVPATS